MGSHKKSTDYVLVGPATVVVVGPATVVVVVGPVVVVVVDDVGCGRRIVEGEIVVGNGSSAG